MRVQEKFKKKLLVEGNDDKHVILALCQKHNIDESFDGIDCDGISNLYAQLPVRFKQSSINCVGVIIDADVELNNRWLSLKTALIQMGFNIPDDLPGTGLVSVNENGQKVGVWIMPDNNQSGMLEDFISFLIPENDEILPIVNSTLALIEEQHLNKYSLNHQAKAKIHSWLSLQKDPGTPMGLAITKKYLTIDNSRCELLINWLNQLFNS